VQPRHESHRSSQKAIPHDQWDKRTTLFPFCVSGKANRHATLQECVTRDHFLNGLWHARQRRSPLAPSPQPQAGKCTKFLRVASATAGSTWRLAHWAGLASILTGVQDGWAMAWPSRPAKFRAGFSSFCLCAATLALPNDRTSRPLLRCRRRASSTGRRPHTHPVPDEVPGELSGSHRWRKCHLDARPFCGEPSRSAVRRLRGKTAVLRCGKESRSSADGYSLACV
jgi:hypothetical protein